MDRVWASPAGGLYFTLILRPKAEPRFGAQLTLLAGAAAARALRRLYKTNRICVKWPNDLLLDGKKVCGILSELRLTAAGAIEYAVIGMGVNVDLRAGSYPSALSETAASLNAAAGGRFSCRRVLAAILEELGALYALWQNEGMEFILPVWKSLNCTLGHRVSVLDEGRVVFEGEAVSIDDAGALMIEDQAGSIRSFDFGEISIRPK